jgi:hypothetical protein
MLQAAGRREKIKAICFNGILMISLCLAQIIKITTVEFVLIPPHTFLPPFLAFSREPEIHLNWKV